MIRMATAEDIPSLVQIHSTALPRDLLPRLGKKYLSQIFYPTVLNQKDTFTYVFEEDSKLKSFVIYTRRPEILTQQISTKKVPLLLSLIQRVPTDPDLIRQIFAHLKGSVLKMEISPQSLSQYGELYLIASDPTEQSKGFGGKIVREGLQFLKSLSQPEGCLVKTSSPQAERFYEKLGFKKIGFEERGSRSLSLLLYRYDMTPRSNS